MTINKDTGMLF